MPSAESERCRPPIPMSSEKWSTCRWNGWSAWLGTSASIGIDGRHGPEHAKKNHVEPEDDDNNDGHQPSGDLLSPGPDTDAGSQDEAPALGKSSKPRRPTSRARPAPAGGDPVLGEVVRLYEAEVGAVTEGVAQRLLALTEEHRDLERWQRAFDAVVGSNVRRLDYLEACLENDGQPKPEARAGPAKGKRTRPRAGRRSAPATSTRHAGGLRGRVVSPEEMPQVEPEEPLPLPQVR
jgi:hypothetical protein